MLRMEFFQGYESLTSKYMTTDVHVVDERGKTIKKFCARKNGRPLLSARVDRAQEFIDNYVG